MLTLFLSSISFQSIQLLASFLEINENDGAHIPE